MNHNIESIISAIVGEDSYLCDEPMKNHTTFKIGGPADILVRPHSLSEVADVYKACLSEGVPCTIIGNGSNVLVSDNGIRGVVIVLLDNFSKITVKGQVIEAEAGALLSKIGVVAMERALTGFEFACGIPGTLGGACIMNAGAYGGEMKDVLLSVTAMDSNGDIREYQPHEMGLTYRNSNFARNSLTVLSARIALRPGNRDEISAVIKDLAARRRDKQDLVTPSAGSTFKRPEGYFAGKLIMDAGLAGFSVGDAAVSTKHCGFVVNKGNAKAADVIELMKQVSDKVEELYGVRLEPEVKLLGEF